jgi:hypothetical protein
VVASLARENTAVRREPIVVEAKIPADRYAELDGRSVYPPLPVLASPPRKPQVTVQQPVPSPMLRSTATSRVPPIVMLKPAGAASARSAGAAAKRPSTAPAKLAAAAPAKVAAALPAKGVAVRPPAARAAAKAPAPKPAEVKLAAAGPRIAPTPARTIRIVPETAARPEAVAPDSDVALLSAIIMHASRHTGERARIAAQTCATGKKCPAPKATD